MRICGKSAWGWPKDRQRAGKVLRACQEAGPVLIDTSDAYGPETSEYLLEEYLHPYDNLVIATKGGLVRGGPRDWTPDGRPEHLRRACHNSLRRLRLQTIDLYQLHAVDDDVAIEESVGALRVLQSEGKIRHIGLSNVTVEQLERARTVAAIASVQNRYNLFDRTHDDVLRCCAGNDITFILRYPLGAGKLARSEALLDIAKKPRAKAGQVALAWLLHRSPVVLPIPGTHSVSHLQQNMAAIRLELEESDISALDAIAESHQNR